MQKSLFLEALEIVTCHWGKWVSKEDVTISKQTFRVVLYPLRRLKGLSLSVNKLRVGSYMTVQYLQSTVILKIKKYNRFNLDCFYNYSNSLIFSVRVIILDIPLLSLFSADSSRSNCNSIDLNKILDVIDGMLADHRCSLKNDNQSLYRMKNELVQP